MNPKKELLWGLWVGGWLCSTGVRFRVNDDGYSGLANSVLGAGFRDVCELSILRIVSLGIIFLLVC